MNSMTGNSKAGSYDSHVMNNGAENYNSSQQ